MQNRTSLKLIRANIGCRWSIRSAQAKSAFLSAHHGYIAQLYDYLWYNALSCSRDGFISALGYDVFTSFNSLRFDYHVHISIFGFSIRSLSVRIILSSALSPFPLPLRAFFLCRQHPIQYVRHKNISLHFGKRTANHPLVIAEMNVCAA